jgi:hypothetical protein
MEFMLEVAVELIANCKSLIYKGNLPRQEGGLIVARITTSHIICLSKRVNYL